MDIVEKKIFSGTLRKDILDYFVSISNDFDSKGTFIGPDWEVKVGKQEYRRLGSINLPSTKILFRADKHRCNEIVTAFRLKFLSAGG